MKKEIEQIKTQRIYLLDLIKDLDSEKLNEIPQGFNNNIIWNLGHVFTSQQRVCYQRAELQQVIDAQSFTDYRPQTKPDKTIEDKEINAIKSGFVSIIDTLVADYDKKIFAAYETLKTPYGILVTNIDEAINFLLFHEGLHVGYIMAMKRVLK